MIRYRCRHGRLRLRHVCFFQAQVPGLHLTGATLLTAVVWASFVYGDFFQAQYEVCKLSYNLTKPQPSNPDLENSTKIMSTRQDEHQPHKWSIEPV